MPNPRNPIYGDTPPGTFCPAAVGVVPNYPATEAAYGERLRLLAQSRDAARASGSSNRRGVPNGWKGQRAEVARLRAAAEVEAGAIAAGLCRRNSWGPDERLDPVNYLHSPERAVTDDRRAELAIATLVSFIISPTYCANVRLRAAQILLRYLLPAKASVGALPPPKDCVGWLQGLVATTAAGRVKQCA